MKNKHSFPEATNQGTSVKADLTKLVTLPEGRSPRTVPKPPTKEEIQIHPISLCYKGSYTDRKIQNKHIKTCEVFDCTIRQLEEEPLP